MKKELQFSLNAREVLKRRYLLKNKNKEVIENSEEMFQRVSRAVSSAEAKWEKSVTQREIQEKFFEILNKLEFLPNSPTLMNAGTEMGQLSACFALPVEDSMKGIFEAVKNMALIHQTGGGTGFSFSHLRPKGDLVYSTKGSASGPVSFMRVFDMATGVIVQGGRRRGANMGVLRCDHPDILEFIQVKKEEGAFSNFNLSVAITDRFMKAVHSDDKYPLVNPRNKRVTGHLSARKVLKLIAGAAWRSGEPGLIFIDEINRHNPTPHLGNIETTNPCGELPLLNFESCNLGSINLSKLVENNQVNWRRLLELVRLGVRFLDDVIEINKFPLPEIEKITKANRKIGLGIMGFADCLIRLGLPYNSNEAVRFAEKLMRFIQQEARLASLELAKKRGVFPNFKGSIYAQREGWKLRNATLTTIAPTGSISIIAGCSSGIEPLFALAFIRNIMEGTRLLEINPYFKKIAKENNFYQKDLVKDLVRGGSIQKVKNIPVKFRKIFVTALDIQPFWHLEIQAAFQKYTDNSVSKTINFPAKAKIEDIRKALLLAHQFKCKGLTVYRYGTKKDQVLTFAPLKKAIEEICGQPPLDSKHPPAKAKWRTGLTGFICAGSEYAGGCPRPHCVF